MKKNLFCKYVIATVGWGFPFSLLDLHLVVKSYLDRNSRIATNFKENIPGHEWALGFVHWHKGKIGRHTCQNIKSSKADTQKEELFKYSEISKTLLMIFLQKTSQITMKQIFQMTWEQKNWFLREGLNTRSAFWITQKESSKHCVCWCGCRRTVGNICYV